MKLSELVSKPNLFLAWQRITAASNIQYKKYYRGLFESFQISLKENLAHLHQKLLTEWKPSVPQRVYLPKPSGLLRPITILSLEDLILYQAFINRVSKKLEKRRSKLIGVTCFSNITSNVTNTPFMLERWGKSYSLYQSAMKRCYDSNKRWVASFDLSAFYDTISHEQLIRTIMPKTHSSEVGNLIKKCFSKWSSPNDDIYLGHGIPQGPIASDLLAEYYLLPLDEGMNKYASTCSFLRYVDDIRVCSEHEYSVRMAALRLEQYCRQLGLIPQSNKFGITKANSLKDFRGNLPSIKEQDGESRSLNSDRALKYFSDSISGRPTRITDKSRARYVLFNAEPNRKLLNKVATLLPTHLEHIDAFSSYIIRSPKSKPVLRALKTMLKDENPYAYVRGELWKILAVKGSASDFSEMISFAKRDFRQRKDCLNLEWGVMEYFIEAYQYGRQNTMNNYVKLSPIVQSLVSTRLIYLSQGLEEICKKILLQRDPISGLSLIKHMVLNDISPANIGVASSSIMPYTINTLKSVGIIGRSVSFSFDPIGVILSTRYGISNWPHWKTLLGARYNHALHILRISESFYDAQISSWLQCQDSFNDALFRSLQEFLCLNNDPGCLTSTTNRHGELIDYGNMLKNSNDFTRTYRNLTRWLDDIHCRRNRLPSAHPYYKRTGGVNSWLKPREHRHFTSLHKSAYREIIRIANQYI